MYRECDSPDLRLCSVDGSSMKTFCIRTIQTVSEPVVILPIDFRHTVHLPLRRIKSFLRSTLNMKCDEIKIRVYESERVGSRYFTLAMIGDDGVDGEYTYKSDTVATTSSSLIGEIFANVSSSEQEIDPNWKADASFKCVFDETFSTEYLHRFTKAMDRSSVELRLAPRKPLVLTYDLGNGHGSYPNAQIRFLLAGQHKDDE